MVLDSWSRLARWFWEFAGMDRTRASIHRPVNYKTVAHWPRRKVGVCSAIFPRKMSARFVIVMEVVHVSCGVWHFHALVPFLFISLCSINNHTYAASNSNPQEKVCSDWICFKSCYNSLLKILRGTSAHSRMLSVSWVICVLPIHQWQGSKSIA